MKMITKVSVVILTTLIWVGMVRAQASELLLSQLSDGQSTYGPSELWTPAGIDSEVADDFEIIGNNSAGQLRISGFSYKLTPAKVNGEDNAFDIATAEYCSVALH